MSDSCDNKQIAVQAFSDIISALQQVGEEYGNKIQIMMPPFIEVNRERFPIEILKDSSDQLLWRV